MASYNQRVKSFNAAPTRLWLQATVIQCHGDIRDDAVRRVRNAMLEAFTDAAHAEGLAATWTMEMKSKTADDFDAMLARRGMALAAPEQPESADARIVTVEPGKATGSA